MLQHQHPEPTWFSSGHTLILRTNCSPSDQIHIFFLFGFLGIGFTVSELGSIAATEWKTMLACLLVVPNCRSCDSRSGCSGPEYMIPFPEFISFSAVGGFYVYSQPGNQVVPSTMRSVVGGCTQLARTCSADVSDSPGLKLQLERTSVFDDFFSERTLIQVANQLNFRSLFIQHLEPSGTIFLINFFIKIYTCFS